MTGTKGNSEFCFPETLNVPWGEAEGNIEGRVETKLTVSRGTGKTRGQLEKQLFCTSVPKSLISKTIYARGVR